MKWIRHILAAIAFFAAIFLPTSTAKAGPGINPKVHVSFCGTQVFFSSDDYPNTFFDSLDIYDSGGTWIERIQVFGHNAESRKVEYDIGYVIGTWGEAGYGIISEAWATVPSCGTNKLADMYVYYSPSPFFGNTHTLTVFSSSGFPSKAVVTSLAGGRLPEDFGYGAPACWGGLYDNGTDKGFFVCDAFLDSVGERRAYLRNDPQGPEFDLQPRLRKYQAMVHGRGK
jgi:hypothetical protein